MGQNKYLKKYSENILEVITGLRHSGTPKKREKTKKTKLTDFKKYHTARRIIFKLYKTKDKENIKKKTKGNKTPSL